MRRSSGSRRSVITRSRHRSPKPQRRCLSSWMGRSAASTTPIARRVSNMPIINNSKTDPNKILPIRYPWAREYYKSAIANNWTPEEVSMQKDVEQWKSTRVLSDGERRLILWNLGFFSTAESLTANNIVLAVYQHITNPESRQYML